LKLGDYNKDGYPDILLITNDLHDATKQHIQLLDSIPCNGKCSPEATSTNKRWFKHVPTGNFPFKNPIGAAFVDFNNDGTLDIFVISMESTGQLTTTVLLNRYFHDSFFVSVLVLNDVCIGSCATNISTPYGVNYAGATIKYSLVDTKGNTRISQSPQLPQQSYQALGSPKTIIGLGVITNYIDDLFIGVSKQGPHITSYQGIIPNSAVVISPYEPRNEGVDDWKFELYMNPASTTLSILISLFTSLLVLGSIVYGLDMMEKVFIL
jgi:integrin alpha FG-GAP repeat containing protein 1